MDKFGVRFSASKAFFEMPKMTLVTRGQEPSDRDGLLMGRMSMGFTRSYKLELFVIKAVEHVVSTSSQSFHHYAGT